MHELKKVLDEIHLTTAKRASEMAATDKKNHQESLELVSSVKQSVELLKNQDLGPIVEGFGNIYYSMVFLHSISSLQPANLLCSKP